MRTYYAASGKMEALHARFRDHTCQLFAKHGMTIVGFWVPADTEEAQKKLVYILAYPSKEARAKSWEAFQNDPEWKAAKEASEKEGKLVNKVESVFLTGRDYSPIKWPNRDAAEDRNWQCSGGVAARKGGRRRATAFATRGGFFLDSRSRRRDHPLYRGGVRSLRPPL